MNGDGYMYLLKKYCKSVYEVRYKKYKMFFLSFAVTFLLFFIFCAVYTSNFHFTEAGEEFFGNILELYNENVSSSFWNSVSNDFLLNLIAPVCIFFMGITLYAPAVCFIFSAFYGLKLGFELRVLIMLLRIQGFSFYFCNQIIFTVFSLFLLFAYSSFVSCVSIRLYTDKSVANGDKIDEEGRCFGGCLFNSVYFRNAINLRFLSSYILFFIFGLFCFFLLAIIHCAFLKIC